MRLRIAWAVVAVACLSWSDHQALAATIEPPADGPTAARYSAELLFNVTDPPRVTLPNGAFGVHYLTGAPGLLGVNSELFPSPFVAVAADVRENFFGRVVATLQYEVVVAGPAGALVPVEVAISGEAAGSVLGPPLGNGSFALEASWSIANAPGGDPLFLQGGIRTSQITDIFFDHYDDRFIAHMTANQRYQVTLRADVGVATGATNGASSGAYAYVDPIFSLPPELQDTYAFFFSEGAGNTPLSEPPTVPGVPEPSVAALVSGGLLALVWLRGRASHSDS